MTARIDLTVMFPRITRVLTGDTLKCNGCMFNIAGNHCAKGILVPRASDCVQRFNLAQNCSSSYLTSTVPGINGKLAHLTDAFRRAAICKHQLKALRRRYAQEVR